MNDTSYIDTILMGLGLFNHSHGSASIGIFVALISTLLGVIAHLGFALGVYIDGKRMFQQKTGPFLAGPFIWAIMTFAGGILTIVAYWVIHYSTLRPRFTPDSDQDAKPAPVAPSRGSDPVY